MKAILCYNNKGGSGKSSLCSSISIMLAQNYKVLMIDTDPQGNLSFTYGFDPTAKTTPLSECINNIRQENEKPTSSFITPTDYDNLDILVGGTNMKETRKTVDMAYLEGNNIYKTMLLDIAAECDYDYVIIDTSPLLGGDITSLLQAVDFALIPMVMDSYTVLGLNETLKYLTNANKTRTTVLDYGIVRNNYIKSDSDNEEFDKMLASKYGKHLFETIVYFSKTTKKNQYAPINPKSRQNYVISIKDVAKELVNRIG